MKNKERFKRYILSFIGVIISFLIVFIIISRLEYQGYRKNFNYKVNAMIEVIRNKYPDVSPEEVMELLNSNSSGMNYLKEYGYDIENDSYIALNDTIHQKYSVIKILLLVLMILLVFYLIVRYEIEDDLEINKIIKLIEDINHKNYELKLDDLSEDKLSILKQEIYKTTVMLREQADNSLKDKISLKESLQDISHQLKTPLTSITIMLDNMIDNPDMDNIVRDKFIRQIKREVLNITFLVQSILTLSKFESNTITFIEEDNNIKDIIDMAISNVANLCDLKDIKIIFKGKNSRIYCDFRWQVEAITNILKNAIEYSDNGSKIIIEGLINNLYYEIKIKDFGKGMDKEDVDNIFKRFYKGKMSSGDSVGIGLSLSKKIIEKDNGLISVDSTKGEGTTFIIKYFK